jgi:serine/threonine protein kinase
MSAKNSPQQESIGNYDLLEKIGDGSMGIVYRARHWQTQAIVAIKVIHPHIARNAVLLKRFEQEYRITSKLDHPNVVRVLEYSNADGRPYLVMELVEGMSLGEKLERDGRMNEDEAIRIIVQVAHGLHRAHRQGLIHRDVKPDNILVTIDNKAKLTDLGLAKDTDTSAELTRTGRGLGTPDFMAPEQFRNAKNASIRCDVYSLAATLYQMLTGRLPFDEEEPVKAMMRKLKNDFTPPGELVPELSERTDWAIRRGMSADPEQRPASCREFAEDLLGQSTRGSKSDVDAGGDPDLWYMVFTDADNMVRTAKGSTRAIQRTLKDGDMGDPATVRASRSPTGPFELLQFFPEFREFVVAPAPGPPLSEMSIANLQRLRRTSAAEGPKYLESREPHPPAPSPADERRPHLRLGSVHDMGYGMVPLWKVLILMVLTVLTTLLAAKYLLLGGK